MVLHAHTHRHAHAAQQGTRAEQAATWLSLACAVHCLLMPIAISVLPLLGASGLTEWGPGAEFAMSAVVVVSALAALAWGYRRHRDLRVALGTLLGLSAYLIGHAFEQQWYGVTLAIAGALTLATSSFFGARLSHACADAACEHGTCLDPACAH